MCSKAQKKKEFSVFFSPLQYGATEGGSAGALLKMDLKNAFNSVIRNDMICQVYKSFHDIGNQVSNMYLGFICQGNSTVSLSSQEVLTHLSSSIRMNMQGQHYSVNPACIIDSYSA